MVDEGLLTARVVSAFDIHGVGLSDTSARLVSAKNGLYLFYFGRRSTGSGLSYNVRLYVVKLSDEGQVVGTPTLIRESAAGTKTGPIEVVTVGYSAYVAIPPTDAGAELLRVSLVDLFEIGSVVTPDHDRWKWQGQCLATDGETVAWGTMRWDALAPQQPFRSDFEVSFYDNALNQEANHPLSASRAAMEGSTCGLLGPRTPDNKWLAAEYADGDLHLQALTAADGLVDGFDVALSVRGADASDGLGYRRSRDRRHGRLGAPLRGRSPFRLRGFGERVCGGALGRTCSSMEEGSSRPRPMGSIFARWEI